MFYIQQHKAIYEICNYLRPFIADYEYRYSEDTLLCEIVSEYLRCYLFDDDSHTEYSYIIGNFDVNINDRVLTLLDEYNPEYTDIIKQINVEDVIVMNTLGYVAYYHKG